MAYNVQAQTYACMVYCKTQNTAIEVRSETQVYAMKKPRPAKRAEGLDVREICGYVAIRPRSSPRPKANGWLYLRKHSETELFMGNIPQPIWFTTKGLGKTVSAEQLQERMKRVVHRMVPGADSIGDVFSTGNGRLAARIQMKEGERGVQQVLKRPADHLYVNWQHLQDGCDGDEPPERENVVDRWIQEYHEVRDEKAVQAWSDAAMKAFEAREKKMAEEKERREKEGTVPDEDGFVMVTSGAPQMKADEAKALGTRGKTGRGHYKSKSGKNRKSLLDVSKGIEKSGFYRWQRENKNMLVDLQRKFKEDQKRIAAIRALGAERK